MRNAPLLLRLALDGATSQNVRMDMQKQRDSDPFRPPAIPIEVRCLHCGKEYESYLIYWEESDAEGGTPGFWCCPIPGCDGKGFGFDIFPTDPDYRNEQGERMWFDDEEDSDDLDGSDVSPDAG